MTNKTLALGICCLVSATAFGSPRNSRHSFHGAKVQSSSGQVEINVSTSTVRSSPSSDGRSVGVADNGSQARVLAVTPKWAKVRFLTGMTGWIARKELAPYVPPSVSAPVAEVVETRTLAREMDPVAEKVAASASSRTKVLSRAATFRGVRYVYGASSRSATDCSGFTSQVFRSVGVKLPRVSFAQATVGKSVGKAQLAPGDLVFFRTRGTGRVSHVGIYVGSGRFIHASSSSGRVTYNALSEAYYRRTFAGARRVLPLGTATQADTIVREAKKHENQMWTNPMGQIDGGSGEIEP